MANKKGYFQGGGGINEPTPGKKKYKSDPAIVVQPRFKEPFYRNYDLYKVPGMEDVGPGVGWHDMQQYESVQAFLEARRNRMKHRYEADDSWQLDSGERTKKQPKMAMRMAIFEKIVKQASNCQDSDIEYTDRRDAFICGKCLHMGPNSGGTTPTSKSLHAGKNHNTSGIDWRNDGDKNDPKYLEWKKKAGDENDGPNFDYGHGAYDAMNQGKKMKSITDFKYDGPTAFAPVDHKNKKTRLDYNKIDFPLDDQISAEPIVPSEESYHNPTLVGPGDQGGQTFPSDTGATGLSSYIDSAQISGEHSYLPLPDEEGRSDEALNFGRDYDSKEDAAHLPDDVLDKLKNKYLTPKETSLFGLPDGISPPEDLDPEATISDENPDYGTTNSGNTLYEGM